MTAEITELHPRRDAGELITAQEAQLRALEGYLGQMARMVDALQRRLDALEGENRMRLTINHQQAKGLQALIRARAGALCQKHGLDEKRHGAAFRAAIKRDLLRLYGIADLHDLPLFAQQEAMSRIDSWSDIRLVLKRREIDRGLDT